MNKLFVAKFLSLFFNPVVFFVFTPYLVVFKQTGDVAAALRWSFFSAIFPLIGLAIVLIGKKRGIFSDLDVSNRKERAKFYLTLWPLLICYVGAALLFRGMFFSLTIIAIGIIVGLLLFEYINQRIKASIHIGVAVSFVLVFGLLYGWEYFFLTVGIVPLLAWSRITLKRHTWKEVFTGGGLGLIITGVTFIVALLIYYL